LRFGTLIHAALAAYYIPGQKRGPHPARTFKQLYKQDAEAAGEFGFKVWEDEIWADAETLGPDMLEHYVDYYGRDDDWNVLVTEHPFTIKVRHDVPFVYTGVLDLVARHRPTNKLWMWDHKSAAGIERDPKWLLLDDQAGAYWTFGLEWLYRQGFLKRKDKLAGIMFNFLRKQYRDDRPKNDAGLSLNQDGSVSGKQPAPYFDRKMVFRDEDDRRSVYERVQKQWPQIHAATQSASTFGDASDLIYKNANKFNCQSCGMFDICELHEMRKDWRELMEATTQTWNPYAEHEIRAAEQK
jgi:hypothetical protein